MEWAWQSSDYYCTAAFKLNKWQILALGIRRSNIRYRAELPGSAGLMTQLRTFAGLFAFHSFGHSFTLSDNCGVEIGASDIAFVELRNKPTH